MNILISGGSGFLGSEFSRELMTRYRAQNKALHITWLTRDSSQAHPNDIAMMTYLCVQDNDGNWYTHMDAVRLLYKTGGVRWAPLLYLPIVKQFGDSLYPTVARNRYRIPNWVTKLIYGEVVSQACTDGVCKVAPDKR